MYSEHKCGLERTTIDASLGSKNNDLVQFIFLIQVGNSHHFFLGRFIGGGLGRRGERCRPEPKKHLYFSKKIKFQI